MKKQTQKEIVVGKLLKNGIVRRNECLALYPSITRLAHYIGILEKEGWEFEARYSKDGKDYGYITKRCPLTKQVYKVGDQTIVKYAK